MDAPRFLTMEEATLVSHAAEQWLRLRDVELNLGEQAAALLSDAVLRRQGCDRQDIAGLGHTMRLQPLGGMHPVEITLVHPRQADPEQAKVSILSALGLDCLGRVSGSFVRRGRRAGMGHPRGQPI